MSRPIATPVSTNPHPGPELPFTGLDVLWLQVTGTVCNIACRHCFISCGPSNGSHPVMETRAVLELLSEARARGVKEYYFTGGEPFLHPDLPTLIAATLTQGPLTILTNGILIDDAVAARLAAEQAKSPYSLDLRVSLDGTSAAENDAVRGRHTFGKILAGAQALVRAGLNPVFTVTTVHATYEQSAGRLRFFEELRALGLERPRVKFIPPFHLGREARRSEGYAEDAVLGVEVLAAGDEHILLCASSRTVTARGVFPCPILIEAAGARMGATLGEGLHPIRLNHPACVTCHVEGFSCRT